MDDIFWPGSRLNIYDACTSNSYEREIVCSKRDHCSSSKIGCPYMDNSFETLSVSNVFDIDGDWSFVPETCLGKLDVQSIIPEICPLGRNSRRLTESPYVISDPEICDPRRNSDILPDIWTENCCPKWDKERVMYGTRLIDNTYRDKTIVHQVFDGRLKIAGVGWFFFFLYNHVI